jgi:hypothetical protein
MKISYSSSLFDIQKEGTLSLMQMAKVSVAVQALKRARIPFISVCKDPTYGGVSASYAMQVCPSASLCFPLLSILLFESTYCDSLLLLSHTQHIHSLSLL